MQAVNSRRFYYAAVGTFRAAGGQGGKSSLQISPAPQARRSKKMAPPTAVAAVKKASSTSVSSAPLPAGAFQKLVPATIKKKGFV
jgi:hypothetical protein